MNTWEIRGEYARNTWDLKVQVEHTNPTVVKVGNYFLGCATGKCARIRKNTQQKRTATVGNSAVKHSNAK